MSNSIIVKQPKKQHVVILQYYNVALALIGSAWMIWLMFDINKYTEMMRKYWQSEGDAGDLIEQSYFQ